MTNAHPVTRFAPSPTGRLHLGHAFAAMIAHDTARASHGRFLLRFEDIDHTRVRPDCYQFIEDDLRWLGLTWDEVPLRQSHRLDAYAAALERLRSRGVVYPCFCTRREVEQELLGIANAPHGPEGPLYPGTCRLLDRTAAQQRLAAGHNHCWRLDAAAAARLAGPLRFHDLRHGGIEVDPLLLGDVILARKDIATSYHLAVTVDDAFQGITLVTRGEDLLPSTHVHRLLQVLLDLPEPEYLHHRLILDEHGVRLAKRHDALSLETLRRGGATPASIRAQLAAQA
jgi:glutamyl-Q tRNA(Asp) synthetase